ACWDHALDLETKSEKWRLLPENGFARKPFWDFVYLRRSSDGSPMYIRASGKPLFDANGEFLGYRGTCTDVTEIMRAQQAVRESEPKFRDYAETASDWYWESDPEHKFTRVTDYERRVAQGFAPVSRIGLTRWE